MVDQFMEENQSTVSLEDGRNNPVNLPTTYTVPDSRFSYGIGGFTNLNLLFLQPSSKATSIYLSSSLMYNLKFADSGEKYTLSVTCPMEKVNPVGNVLEPILPVLALAILIMSLAGSVFYSLYVAKPIIKISGISKKISELNFKEHCRENRKDEIGILAHSLNAMSNQLSAAMADLQKTNALLKSDMERERELERQRLAFFSAVSHELKTPITIIKGQIEGMINHVGVYKDRDKYLLRALQTADKMDSMVRELLVVSHMESSDFALHREDINFSYLLLENIHEYEEIPEESARQFFLYIEPDIMVNADRALLQKAVANLISNATKYSPQGEIIEIAAHRRNGGLYCSIENGGVHIPDEALPRLFDAFYRTEQSRGRKTGGSGMGLYLVKIILERHGADFGIENTEKGVRFWFALPA
jgi:Signal transduction histidine kinase